MAEAPLTSSLLLRSARLDGARVAETLLDLHRPVPHKLPPLTQTQTSLVCRARVQAWRTVIRVTLLSDVKSLRKQHTRSVMQVNLFWSLLLSRHLLLIFNQRRIPAFALSVSSVSLHTFYTNSDSGAIMTVEN